MNICTPYSFSVLYWPHTDLMSFVSHHLSLQGSAPVWPNSLLVEPLGVTSAKRSTAFSSCSRVSSSSQNSHSRDQHNSFRLWKRTDVAKLTFDLYKNNPEDFIGCLNVKATLYGVYSVSYDLRCYAAKKMLKWVLLRHLKLRDTFLGAWTVTESGDLTEPLDLGQSGKLIFFPIVLPCPDLGLVGGQS